MMIVQNKISFHEQVLETERVQNAMRDGWKEILKLKTENEGSN